MMHAVIRSETLTLGDRAWDELLARLSHDVFHTPDYHRLSGFGHRGEARLFAYREGDASLFIWPHLAVPIPGTTECDVSSVYGYPGPLSNGDGEFVQRAWEAACDHWREERVVSVFTRFHPILGNAKLLADMGGVAAAGLCRSGSTVSIDLTPPSSEQVRRYQKVLRQEIRRSRDLGFVTEEDREWCDVAIFVQLYRETMQRRGSRSEYVIDDAWVEQLRAVVGKYARLFVTRWQGTTAAALLALEHGPFLHAYLTGINSELTAYSPLKVLLDDVREWGTQRGLQVFHLGGGVGGAEDSLFQFKRRFSPLGHEFHVGRWILD